MISSLVRSLNFVVRDDDSCAAIDLAFSLVPPFSRYVGISVAQKLWQQVSAGNPTFLALCLTIRIASFRVIWRFVNYPFRSFEKGNLCTLPDDYSLDVLIKTLEVFMNLWDFVVLASFVVQPEQSICPI